jgi:hypothetical protein
MRDQINSQTTLKTASETLQAILASHSKGEISNAGVSLATQLQPDMTIRVTVTASDAAGQVKCVEIGKELQSSGHFTCSSIAGGVSCVSLG